MFGEWKLLASMSLGSKKAGFLRPVLKLLALKIVCCSPDQWIDHVG
jgi:hypothetical protein